MLKVIAYTGGHNTPSRTPRVQHYVAPLTKLGIEIVEHPSGAGMYPPDRKWARPVWGLWNLGDRMPDVLRSFRYDVTFLQREMLSTFVTWEPFTKRPRVFDIDDAIWVHRGGGFARRVVRLCDHVICGNQFLAEEFSNWNPSVSVLPSSVDTQEFYPGERRPNEDRPIIGWMGLSSGLSFLEGIEPALQKVLRMHPKTTLRVVSDRPPRFRNLPTDQVEYLPWSADRQVRMIQEMAIGIMPLDDTVVSRGKCSFKMLLYMACGIPVVVSSVGMNVEVLQKGCVGFGASGTQDWVVYLDELIRKPEARVRMGSVGREIILQYYSVDVLASRLAEILFAVSEGRPPLVRGSL